jgi:hypothetical protein
MQVSTVDSTLIRKPICPIKPSLVEDRQATLIQKVFRGAQARQSFLPRELYPQYSFQCEKISESTPRAEGGKVPVYLPSDLPSVVLKLSGKADAQNRFNKAQAMRLALQSEGLSSLVIPKGRTYKEFSVEERLPICIDPLHNAMTYRNNEKLFDLPVRQMTRLFSKAYIDYLVQLNSDSDGILRIRYDNIPFFITGEGDKASVKIGLIDLERSKIGANVKSSKHKIFILASLFPLHADIIREEARKCFEGFGEEEERALEKYALYGQRYLERVCT